MKAIELANHIYKIIESDEDGRINKMFPGIKFGPNGGQEQVREDNVPRDITSTVGRGATYHVWDDGSGSFAVVALVPGGLSPEVMRDMISHNRFYGVYNPREFGMRTNNNAVAALFD